MSPTRQQQILAFLRAFRESHAYGPTIRELRDGLRLSSNSVVAYNLQALRRQGLVTWVDGRARTLEVVGQVAARPECPSCGNAELLSSLVKALEAIRNSLAEARKMHDPFCDCTYCEVDENAEEAIRALIARLEATNG